MRDREPVADRREACRLTGKQDLDEQLAIDASRYHAVDHVEHDRFAITASHAFVNAAYAQCVGQARRSIVWLVFDECIDVDWEATCGGPLQQIGAIEAQLITDASARDLVVIDPAIDLPFRRTQ